ncbi:hypothetical protein PsorP6_013435 [Peronosclerospora sorghi]|uniref:Uncharacterized protein n=1 Tax=Peronosclerospora sorghi TaxID=230839 RepID=A0ACC0VI31_9STRA|nr:hypothetical protein PsorP6_013435 [Peronosclerospora sorghi]
MFIERNQRGSGLLGTHIRLASARRVNREQVTAEAISGLIRSFREVESRHIINEARAKGGVIANLPPMNELITAGMSRVCWSQSTVAKTTQWWCWAAITGKEALEECGWFSGVFSGR